MFYRDYTSAFDAMMANRKKAGVTQYLFNMAHMPTGIDAYIVVDGTRYEAMMGLGHKLVASVPAIAPARSSVTFDVPALYDQAKPLVWSWSSAADPTARKAHWRHRVVDKLPAEPEILQPGQRVTHNGSVMGMKARVGTVIEKVTSDTTRYRIRWDGPFVFMSSESRANLTAHCRPTQPAALTVGARVVYTGVTYGANHEIIGKKGRVISLGSSGHGSVTVHFDDGNIRDLDDNTVNYRTFADHLTLLEPWED